jgi:hypothetical protein
MDLVGRKLDMDGGATAGRFLDGVAAEAEALKAAGDAFRPLGAQLAAAVETARRTTAWMLDADHTARAAGCVPYLRLLSLASGAGHLARAARLSGEADRLILTRFFFGHLLSGAEGCAAGATQGPDLLYALDADGLAA